MQSSGSNGKKLLWYRPELVFLHAGPNSVLSFRDAITNRELSGSAQQLAGIEWHVALKRCIKMNNLMVDGTGLSHKHGDGLAVARAPWNDGKLVYDLANGRNVDDDFAAMVQGRVDHALARARHLGADRIYISYSGGSDSLLILAAFMQHHEASRLIREGSISLLANRRSMREDLMAWERIKHSGMGIGIIDHDTLMGDHGNWLLVTGEGESYGTFFVRQTHDYLGPDQRLKHDWRILERIFLASDPGGLAWDYFRELMALAPFEVRTLHQAWYWFESCVDRQDDPFKYNTFSGHPVRADCIGGDQRCFYFMGGQDFVDHGAYMIIENRLPDNSDWIKWRSDEYTSRWLGLSDTRIKPKVYSLDMTARHIRKVRIFDDFTWDCVSSLEGYGASC